ncbi:adenylyl-sulfate kinase [Calidifontibacter terrae]
MTNTAREVQVSASELDELALLRLGLVASPSLPPLSPGDVVVDLEGAPYATVVDGGFEWHPDESLPFAELYRASTPPLVEPGEAPPLGEPGEAPPLGEPGEALAEPVSKPPAQALWVDVPSDRIAEGASPNTVLLVPLSPSHQPGHAAIKRLQAALRSGLEVIAVPVDLEAHPERRAEIERAYGLSASLLSAHESPSPAGTFILLTGLSGSGKSTIARGLREALVRDGETVTLLDGDQVRRELSAGLSFSPADRDRNIRRIGWVGAQLVAHGGVVVACPIAPYDATRQEVRAMVEQSGGRMILVHIATSLQECERRDRKGLYARARAGEIPDFTGISAPYEAPTDADLRIDTAQVPVAEAVRAVRDLIAR